MEITTELADICVFYREVGRGVFFLPVALNSSVNTNTGVGKEHICPSACKLMLLVHIITTQSRGVWVS